MAPLDRFYMLKERYLQPQFDAVMVGHNSLQLYRDGFEPFCSNLNLTYLFVHRPIWNWKELYHDLLMCIHPSKLITMDMSHHLAETL